MISILLISILFQLLAVYFALRLIKTTGKLNAWLLLSLAFVLMGLRRFSSLIGTYFPQTEFLFGHEVAESIGLVISIVVFVGVILIARLFRQAQADSDRAKTAAHDLAISEARFKNLLLNVPAVTYTLLFKKKIIFHYISPVLREWTGKSPEELYARPSLWKKLVPSDDQNRLKELLIESFKTGRKFTSEHKILSKSGDWIWVRNEAFPDVHPQSKQKQLHGILTIISHQKEFELRINRLNSILETVNRINRLIAKEKDISALLRNICEILTRTRGYFSTWIALIDETGKFTGFAESGIGDSFQKLTEQLKNGHIPPCIQRAQQASEGILIEDVESFCRDCPLSDSYLSHSVWVAPLLYEGQLFGFLALAIQKNVDHPREEKVLWEEIVSDISYGLHERELEDKRRLMEQALQKSEERFRSIVETSQEGIFIVDSDYRIIYCNQEMAHILERPEAQILNHDFREFLDAESIPIVEDRYRRRQKGEKIPARYQFKIIRKSGEVRWVEISAAVINSGTPHVQTIATLLDVTDQIKLQQQFLQAQKMEAVGRLAGGVAHDFNNILTAINGYAQLLLSEMEPENPLREDVEEIYKSGNRAAALTHQLLAFSRRQVLEPQILSLNDVIQGSKRMIQRMIGEDVELVFHPDENLGTVYVDPGQVDQILLNLAVNARDAMPDGGRLIVETSNISLAEAYTERHVSVKPGDYILLAITDTGQGMSKEIMEHIFEPFFTTKEKDRGTGLGLSTVYGIVKQSGGHIWVYSEPGKGTTFKIYFPRVDAPRNAGKNESVSDQALRGTETILVVEDEKNVLEVASRSLSKLGYTVLTAPNGKDALKIARSYPRKIDLILTDVVMPNMPGDQLIREIQKFRSDFRVLFMSGYPDRAITKNGFLKNGLFFIQKPFTPQRIARKVREILNRK
ncbi:MAG: PAS domain S-box protein [Calditrichaeota bacterium]|nr:PAS domain S-box protein [Calditrichota bacterium]